MITTRPWFECRPVILMYFVHTTLRNKHFNAYLYLTFSKEKRFKPYNFSSAWFPMTCYGQFALAVYLTIILRNRAEYHLILSRRGRRPSWLNQGTFRKIEQDNCFIIQQILIDYHFHNEKNYGSMMKTLKASNT